MEIHQTGSVKDRAKRKLERDMGSELLAALHDPMTVEIMCNADGGVWHERQGEGQKHIYNMRPAQAQAIIETVAGYHDLEITRNNPLIECKFPLDGSRFAGQLPPIVGPAPTFAIRKPPPVIFTLDEYVAAGIMTPAQQAALSRAVTDHRNILVIGGTGSGKTTLVNSIIDEMVRQSPNERIVTIEDTGEIQCAARNRVQYNTSLDVSMSMLLKTTLRMRPDRILVGEVRGEEALDLLDAWNTGHPGGAATIHANSALEGLTRLHSLVTRNRWAPAAIEPLIGAVVHVIVYIAKTPDHGRRIQDILEVDGFEAGKYVFHPL